MRVELKELNQGRAMEVRLTGKLVKADYELFVPAVERLIQQHGSLCLLVLMHEFHGWTGGALWEDTKFAFHHFRDIKRLAVVGEKKWQQGMVVFCKPFTAAEIRYFEQDQAAEARNWVLSEWATRQVPSSCTRPARIEG